MNFVVKHHYETDHFSFPRSVAEAVYQVIRQDIVWGRLSANTESGMKRVLNIILVGLFSCVAVVVASAQIAPQHTWPELMEAVQERANRNAYPLTGMKPEDVREIVSNIGSLDRDEWSSAWSAMGDRYSARGDGSAKADRSAAAEAYLMAYRYYAFGGWPTQNSPGKKASFEKSLVAYRKHAVLADPPIEYVRIPFRGGEVRAYLALPKGVHPAPVVLAIGGLDSYKEYWANA